MASRGRIRLVSWNVHGRFGSVWPRQAAWVVDRRPDLVALQEVRIESAEKWRAELALAGLRHALDSRSLLDCPAPPGKEYSRRYFNLVASRWPLKEIAPLDIAYPERYLAASVRHPISAVELHTAHLPPGSTRGLIKVEMFEALFGRLAVDGATPRILCGDFNSPKSEGLDGGVKFWGDRFPDCRARWEAAERSVVLGLRDHDLADLFREINGYDASDVSWVATVEGAG